MLRRGQGLPKPANAAGFIAHGVTIAAVGDNSPVATCCRAMRRLAEFIKALLYLATPRFAATNRLAAANGRVQAGG
jgi:hypothetical protein